MFENIPFHGHPYQLLESIREAGEYWICKIFDSVPVADVILMAFAILVGFLYCKWRRIFGGWIMSAVCVVAYSHFKSQLSFMDNLSVELKLFLIIAVATLFFYLGWKLPRVPVACLIGYLGAYYAWYYSGGKTVIVIIGCAVGALVGFLSPKWSGITATSIFGGFLLIDTAVQFLPDSAFDFMRLSLCIATPFLIALGLSAVFFLSQVGFNRYMLKKKQKEDKDIY